MQRSVKVKFKFENLADRRMLWFTHLHFHRGVRYYQKLLLAMRGEDVHIRDPRTKEPLPLETTSAAVWRADMVSMIEKARVANGRKDKLTQSACAEAVNFFRNYYESLMNKDHADYADEPKGKLNILINSESVAGTGEAKGGRPGKALEAMRALFSKDQALAKKYSVADAKNIKKAEYDKLIEALKREHQSDAIVDLLNKHSAELAKKEKKRQDSGKIIRKLQESGVLRIIPPYLESINAAGEIVGAAPFEYGMWSVAVATLRSWNTWNEKAKQDRAELERELTQINAKFFANEKEFPAEYQRILEDYEKDQHEAYARTVQVKKRFRITRPMLRNWETLREKWLNAPDEKTRKEQIAEWQQENRSYGDANLFRYLALEANKSIWFDSEKYLSLWVRRNAILDQIDRRSGYAHLSLADEIYHPVWINNEAAESKGRVGSGNNKPGYFLQWGGKECRLQVRLLSPGENKVSVSQATGVILPSYQWQQFRPADNGDGFIVTDPASGESFVAKPKGAKLMFDRVALEKLGNAGKNLDSLAVEDIPDCYFNCSWEVQGRTPSEVQKAFQLSGGNEKFFLGWFASQEEAKRAFASTSKKKGVCESRVENRSYLFRVMSVDLGLRSFAACSVFTVWKTQPNHADKKFSIPLRSFITGKTILHAIHERSFLLALQGERVSGLVEDIRRAYRGKGQAVGMALASIKGLRDNAKLEVFEAWKNAPTTAQMRQKINAMRNLRRLCREKNPVDREAALCDYIRRYQNARHGWPFASVSADELKDRLAKHFNGDEKTWVDVIDAETKGIGSHLTEQFTAWRKAFRKKRFVTVIDPTGKPRRVGFAGNSLWNIEDLTDTRRLMLAWHNRAETVGDQKNLEKYSRFAPGLLAHIQDLKDNRLKEGAHALVMSALGYEYVATNKTRAVLLADKKAKFRPATEKEIHEILAKKQRPKFWQTGLGNNAIKFGKWLKVYEPCDAIIFEDLSRFQFKSDRPRVENSMLMKWAHRSIPKETQMQGELYGIGIATVRAEFTSRFHARTMAPGIRGRFFKPEELKESYNSLLSLRKNYSKEEDISRHADFQLRPLLKFFRSSELEGVLKAALEQGRDVLLPCDGGEYFITLNAEHNLTYLNADINAAQSIARRWLTRYAEPVRLTVAYLDKRDEFIVNLGQKTKGNRVQRALGYGILKLTSEKEKIKEKIFEAKWQPMEKQDWFKEYSSYFRDTDDGPEIAEVDREEYSASAEEIESIEGKYSVFRDISGFVMDKDKWYSSKKFWHTVKDKIAKKLQIPENLIFK